MRLLHGFCAFDCRAYSSSHFITIGKSLDEAFSESINVTIYFSNRASDIIADNAAYIITVTGKINKSIFEAYNIANWRTLNFTHSLIFSTSFFKPDICSKSRKV